MKKKIIIIIFLEFFLSKNKIIFKASVYKEFYFILFYFFLGVFFSNKK